MREHRNKPDPKLSHKLAYPLSGIRVLVPRAAGQGDALVDALKAQGALPIAEPVIAFFPPKNKKTLKKSIKQINTYHWIVFSSQNAVQFFFEALYSEKKDARVLSQTRICAVGPSTAEKLIHFGILADLIPTQHLAEGLVKVMLRKYHGDLTGMRFLLPRAEVARDVIPKEFENKGGIVDVVPVYRTGMPVKEQRNRIRMLFARSEIDTVVFTSSSTVHNLVSILGKRASTLLSQVTMYSIGPITTQSAKKMGLKIAVTAKKYTTAGLIDAMVSTSKEK